MPYTNISAVMTPAEKAAITAGLNAVQANMPYAVNLTPEERLALASVEDNRLSFVTKCMEYASANPSLVPGFVSLPEAVKDFNLMNDIRPLKALAAQMLELLADTAHAAEYELYRNFCLEFYESVKRGSQLNVPGTTAIYNDLKPLFEDQGGGQPPPGPAEEKMLFEDDEVMLFEDAEEMIYES